MSARRGHPWFARLYWTQRVWEAGGVGRHRRGIARGATGRILEIGVGTGFTLPLYPSAPSVALDVDPAMIRRARRRSRRLGIPTSFVVADAARLPFASGSFDTVVSCLVLCSAGDPSGVVREAVRALAPGGQLRFLEHGRSSRPGYAALQRAVDPLWRRMFGGCRLTRDPVDALARAGARVSRLDRCSGGTVARGRAHASVESAATPAADPPAAR